MASPTRRRRAKRVEKDASEPLEPLFSGTQTETPGEIETAWLSILGARHNNLKDIDVHFPLGRFIAVTGVSGSGKSSLVNDVLREALAGELNGAKTEPGAHRGIEGQDRLDKVIDIDQSPIGRTPRSNPATYIKVFDEIRALYAKLPEARTRGYKQGRFSFNVTGGRCEGCDGNGARKLEMDFLADVWVTCPVCSGRRFNRETLQIRFKDKNIHDVLEMDVQESVRLFENIPKINGMLQTLHDVGLDYMKLGQPSPTLSGGEAQRIKLARELCKRSTGQTLYILDEPTTGLHFEDVRKLLAVLHGFVDAGNTVVVIEHNLDVIKTADWVVDLGPEGGAGGGLVVVCGTPEEVADCKESHTGRALKPLLNPKRQPFSLASAKNGKKSRIGKLAKTKPLTHLAVEGAKQHNLRDVSAAIPLQQMTVFCGPSGSGKSSLAIDTLYAEGQRRYVESLSAYARQFLGQMQKPNVEKIVGLPPAICIEQKSASKSPRSTVGTVTEIYDYLRILTARLGQPYCPDCDAPIGTQTSEEIIDKLMLLPEGRKVYLMAPVEREPSETYESLFTGLQRTGFVRMRIDGKTYDIAQPPKIDRRRRHLVEVIVDRAVIRHSQRSRIADSVEAALDLGRGVMHVAYVDSAADESKWKIDRFSQHFVCDRCNRSFEELTPNHFSFNSPVGWCPQCEGLGTQAGGDSAALGVKPELSLRQGALSLWPSLFDPESPFVKALEAVAGHAGFSLDEPFESLSPEHRRALFHGTGDDWIEFDDGAATFQFKGIFPAISEASRVSWAYRHRLGELVGQSACSTCKGSRLRDDAAAVRLKDRTIGQWCASPLNECLDAFKSLDLTSVEKQIAGELLREVTHRLQFLVDVGLDYLTLDRPTPSLSGGEAQRIRLASQLGSGLTGVLYLLDEPTIGLHPRDNNRLLQALSKLRDLGNTLVLVEHDREVIDSADYLLDFGPGAGRFGGTITAQGKPTRVMKMKKSLTGNYLSGKEAIAVPTNRRPVDGPALEVVGAAHHNLNCVDARFPLGCFTAVTGVSGSGKSSLVNDVLLNALSRRLHRAQVTPGVHEEIRGIEHIDKVISVDQQPIGASPNSNPATYSGVFELIRELFARLPESKVRGWHAGRFSFNKPGGRCEVCEGAGQKKIEMHFLADVWVECDACQGRRYTADTLSVTYKGHSIADVLELSVADALSLFENFPKIRRLLQTLCDVGLDYMPLGQPAPTLSGGEAQRVKLAAELARPNTGKTVYILDEPTTGLHFDDLKKLLNVLHRLVDLGNAVIVIEHNLDVIKTADWIVDVGPEAGDRGGHVVFSGTPEELVARLPAAVATASSNGSGKKKAKSARTPLAESAACTETESGNGRPVETPVSHTAVALAPALDQGPHDERPLYDPGKEWEDKEGDLELSEVGKEAAMPWEVDGPRWHTVDRVARSGKTAKWDGQALAWLIDRLQEIGVFSETNWNSRHMVEIAAARKTDGWFLHALTGEEWLLRLKFRPGRGAFKQELLDRTLGLKPLDELTEVPLYGRDPRVRVRKLRSLFQEVELTVNSAAEIQTPEFEEFLDKAIESFCRAVDKKETNPEEAMPWSVDGPSWHRGAKGFKPGRKIYWDLSIVDPILQCIEQASPQGEWDWASRDSVKRRLPGSGMAWARLMTKKQQCLELNLVGRKGDFNLSAIDRFGVGHEIRANNKRWDVVRLSFQSEDDFSAGPLVEFLVKHAQGFLEEFADADGGAKS